MRRTYLFLALIIGIAPAPDADAVPVTIAACRTRDAYADAMVGTLQQLATSTDPRDAGQRSRLGIPATTAANVTYVTIEQTCSKAASAFAANVGVDNGPPLSGSVYVVKV